MASASLQNQVKGVVLLNTAGQFGDATVATPVSEENVLQKHVLKPLKEIFQRVVLSFLFWQAKQPARIESVLKSVSHFLNQKFYLICKHFPFPNMHLHPICVQTAFIICQIPKPWPAVMHSNLSFMVCGHK